MMRWLQRAAAAAAVVVAGIVLGSGISGYALSPADEACIWQEKVSTDSTVSLVPFGTRCGSGAETLLFAPSVPAWVAWMVAMTALVAVAVRRGGDRAIAGALSAAVVIALAGGASHWLHNFAFTVMAVAVIGTPAAFVTRHLLIPRDGRALDRSLGVVGLLVPVVFVVASFFNFMGDSWGHLGCILGLGSGAAISVMAGRLASSQLVTDPSR